MLESSPSDQKKEMAPGAAENGEESVPKPHLIFVYGTLKRGLPNHFLMGDLIRSNDAVPFSSCCRTVQPTPLVRGPFGIPYLLNIPGSGRHVRGELYAVSARGLVRLDELEGTSHGHYERLPMKVVIQNPKGESKKEEKMEKEKTHTKEEDKEKEKECDVPGNNQNGDTWTPLENVIEAEAYYAHRSYAEDLWRKTGMVGFDEYTVADSDTYVKPENRRAVESGSFVDQIRAYVASSD